MAFPLARLYLKTPRKVSEASRAVRVLRFDPRRGVMRGGLGEGGFWRLEYRTSGEKKEHVCRVKFFGEEVGMDVPAWVWCDCGDFKYREEYVLTKAGVSSIIAAKAAPPRETNPQMEQRLCKHLMRARDLVPQVRSFLAEKRRATFGAPAAPAVETPPT